MSKKEDFYVGYMDKAPESLGKFLKTRVLIIFFIVLAVALLFSVGQSEFKDSKFELGNLKIFEGTFYASPYPMFRVSQEGGEFMDIMLIGFGKFGAELETLNPENGSTMVLEGTRVYYDNKMLLQLQPNLEGKYEITGKSKIDLNHQSLGKTTLRGEIVDPKCFFGVMKPGFGKIHRSCATRCLTGGIPPVFVTTDGSGTQEYYILTDAQGNRLGDEFLQMVGKPSEIKGELYRLGDWYQIRIQPDEITLLAEASRYYQ